MTASRLLRRIRKWAAGMAAGVGYGKLAIGAVYLCAAMIAARFGSTHHATDWAIQAQEMGEKAVIWSTCAMLIGLRALHPITPLPRLKVHVRKAYRKFFPRRI